MAKSTRNEFEFRSGLLDALGVEHTEADAKNEERWRAKMLDGLEVEYNQNDVNQFDLFRAKLVEGVEAKAEGGGGGGGSSDLSTAEVTFICSNEPEINFAFINVQNDGIYSLLNITESTQTVTVPLYKNKLSCSIPLFYMSITSTSGSITGTQKNGYIISGDCTINYTLPN